MTNEEAKCIIQDMLDDAEKYGDIDYDNLNDFISASKVAIEALSDVPDTNVGKWIRTGDDGYCSVCHCDMPIFVEDWGYKSCETEFCPNCGAKMRGEEK